MKHPNNSPKTNLSLSVEAEVASDLNPSNTIQAMAAAGISGSGLVTESVRESPPSRILVNGRLFVGGVVPKYPTNLEELIERRIEEQTVGVMNKATRDIIADNVRIDAYSA